MAIDIFEGYETDSQVNEDIIEKYSKSVPKELLSTWEKYGFGCMLNGYLRVINPEDYRELIEDTYFRGDISIPVFTTAFGDVITWEENRYLRIVKYKNGIFQGISAGFKFFFDDIAEGDFDEEMFEMEKYSLAVELLGKPKIDECFGYVPLLALGGNDDVENLKIMKMKEHIYLISQVAGKIGE